MNKFLYRRILLVLVPLTMEPPLIFKEMKGIGLLEPTEMFAIGCCFHQNISIYLLYQGNLVRQCSKIMKTKGAVF
jgi:hypothetical protein